MPPTVAVASAVASCSRAPATRTWRTWRRCRRGWRCRPGGCPCPTAPAGWRRRCPSRRWRASLPMVAWRCCRCGAQGVHVHARLVGGGGVGRLRDTRSPPARARPVPAGAGRRAPGVRARDRRWRRPGPGRASTPWPCRSGRSCRWSPSSPRRTRATGWPGSGKLGCSYCAVIASASALTVKPPRASAAPAGLLVKAAASRPEPPATRRPERRRARRAGAAAGRAGAPACVQRVCMPVRERLRWCDRLLMRRLPRGRRRRGRRAAHRACRRRRCAPGRRRPRRWPRRERWRRTARRG